MAELYFPDALSKSAANVVELSPFENNVKNYAQTAMAIVFTTAAPSVASVSLDRLRQSLPATLSEFELFNSIVFEAEASDAGVLGKRALFGGVWASVNDPRFKGIPLIVSENTAIDAEAVFPTKAGVSHTHQYRLKKSNNNSCGGNDVGGAAADVEVEIRCSFTDAFIPSGTTVGFVRGGLRGVDETTAGGGGAACPPPVALQFTVLKNGFAIGFCATHCVADAASASLFLRRWCARAATSRDANTDASGGGSLLACLPLPRMGPGAYRFPSAEDGAEGTTAAFPSDLPLLKGDLWQSGGGDCPFFMEAATQPRPSVAKSIEAGEVPKPHVGERADWSAIMPPMPKAHPNPERFATVEERMLLFTPEMVNQIAAAANEQARDFLNSSNSNSKNVAAANDENVSNDQKRASFSRQTSLVAHIASCVMRARRAVGGFASSNKNYAIACTVGMRPRVPAVVALERDGEVLKQKGVIEGAPIENPNLLIGSPIALFSAEIATDDEAFANNSSPHAVGALALAISNTLSTATEKNVERLTRFLQKEPSNEHCWLTGWGDRALIYTSWANLGLYTVVPPADGAVLQGCHAGMVAADGILQIHEANAKRFGKGGFQVLLVLRGDVMDALLSDKQLLNGETAPL